MSLQIAKRSPTPLARALGRNHEVDHRLYELVSSRVPAGHGGLRIAHLTDIHVGRMTPEGRLAVAVHALNECRPDVVCLTGDFVAHGLGYLPRLTQQLKALKAPAFATLGNHDHWHGARAVVRALEQANIHVLDNASVRLETPGGSWRLVGVDDAVTGHQDVEKAFAEAAGEPVVVLSHLAELAPALERRGAVLVLSGHTHGGQLHLGGLTHRVMRRMGHQYLLGWYHVGPTAVYVNRGLGAAVFPWRSAMARSEVACIILRGLRNGPVGGQIDAEAALVNELSHGLTWPDGLGERDDKTPGKVLPFENS